MELLKALGAPDPGRRTTDGCLSHALEILKHRNIHTIVMDRSLRMGTQRTQSWNALWQSLAAHGVRVQITSPRAPVSVNLDMS
ncbi:hypothetical protein, partial [Ramlibacter sp.]|uniref:hypothetical protein n=1 Tax=Ramlibacter sp. TaxID=1917967 RepID=UPI00257A6535